VHDQKRSEIWPDVRAEGRAAQRLAGLTVGVRETFNVLEGPGSHFGDVSEFVEGPSSGVLGFYF